MDDKHNDSLTVACISVVGGTALYDCVSSILRSGLDCMVVAEEQAITGDVAELVSDHHLELVITHGDAIPARRAIAVTKTATDWIALIEDTCTIDEQWRHGCEDLMACKDAIAGSGPVLLGQSLSIRARALYCSDYGKFFPASLRRSSVSDATDMFKSRTLPGVNLLYRCKTVMQYINDEGLIESEVNRRLNEVGHGIYIHEKLAVTLQHADDRGATFCSRFTHGRLYGGLQSRGMNPLQRILRAMACIFLPLILSRRSLGALAGVTDRVIATTFYIIVFETLWSCGECTGYLLGTGRSLEDWK